MKMAQCCTWNETGNSCYQRSCRYKKHSLVSVPKKSVQSAALLNPLLSRFREKQKAALQFLPCTTISNHPAQMQSRKEMTVSRPCRYPWEIPKDFLHPMPCNDTTNCRGKKVSGQ